MEKLESIENIEKLNKLIEGNGTLLYSYIRGSHAYGLNTPDSDMDSAGIFIANTNNIYGFNDFYKEQLNDEKNDNVLYEVGKFLRLLIKGNPTMLEALFIPDHCILYKHPLFDIILKNRNLFISKQTITAMYLYAKSQIEKARGLNKKIVNPVKERLGVLDFTHTFYRQGSTKIKNWLEFRGLNQKYCGLNNIPNMHNVYGLYYDFGNHILHEENWENNKSFLNYVITLINRDFTYDNINDVEPIEYGIAIEWLKKQKAYGYSGLIAENKETTELRLSSINDKNDKPLTYIHYNKDGFTKHCKDYKEYKEWEKNRNPKRYESNLDKNYDSKNMMHCFRLIHMGIEVARGESMNLYRIKDHDFLMNIRNHKYEYDELMVILDKEIQEMNNALSSTKLPLEPDINKINDILIDIRKQYNKIEK